MMLVPDERHHDIYEADIAGHLAAGNMLMFGHGFSIHYGEIEPPADVDVALAAPKGPGHLVRRQYLEGSGVPGLIADPPGRDRQGQRARRWRTPRASAAPAAASSRQPSRTRPRPTSSASRPSSAAARPALVQAGFETLVEAGYHPEMAYFECLHELKLIVDLMYEKGLAGMRYSISNTAEYGDYTRGPRIINDERARR